MSATIYTGDCRSVLDLMFDDDSVDSIVCDPPYELTQKRPGGRSEATRGKVMGGFMGMKWDGTGVAFDPATWAAALRVAKPGAFLLAFGGTRTYHRLACAIEDAGWEIRDQIGWAFGSGFPKSHNGDWGGTALKPAWEPICVARKPLIGTVEQNWQAHGTGGLNIDGCRVGETKNVPGSPRGRQDRIYGAYGPQTGTEPGHDPNIGRWPANLIHDGSDEVLDAFPQAPGQLADAKLDGTLKTANVYSPMRYGRAGEPSAGSDNEGIVGFKMKPGTRRLDTGSAARFFYCAKASKSDRETGNNHPTVKPTELMRYLCRLVTPPGGACSGPVRGLRLHRQGGGSRRLPVRGYRTQPRLRRDRQSAHRRSA
jgi:DNA modification methylase